jgi:hypothetical protein
MQEEVTDSQEEFTPVVHVRDDRCGDATASDVGAD